MTRRIAMAAVLSVVGAGAAQAQDVAAGEASFKKNCALCHTIGEAAKNRVGPLLNGLDGRTSGTVPGFAYSAANKGSGIVWSEAQFLEYIKDPKAKVPGTKMIFAGIKDAGEAKALWAYLASFDSQGKKK